MTGAPIPVPRSVRLAGLAAFAIAFAAQLVLFRAELREVATQTFHPGHTDATEYVERAMGIRDGDWSLTLDTGFRTPGYPLFVALFLAGGAGLTGLRIAQCALVSIVPALLGRAAFRLSSRREPALLAVLLGALFLPMYWFSTWVFAEAPSVALGGALLLVLARLVVPADRPRRIEALAGLLVGVATLLKPNQLLLLVPVIAAILLSPARSRGSRVVGSLLAASIALGMVAPWSAAVSGRNERPVLLSTADGLNLWIGVGGSLSEEGSLFGRTAKRLALHVPAEDEAVHAAALAETDWSRRSATFRDAALARIAARPVEVTALGLAKVLHSAGLSLRGIPDYLYAMVTVASLLAAVFVFRSGADPSRRYAIVWVAATCATALQAFVFLPNLRFRAVFYDPATLVLIALAVPAFVRSARTLDRSPIRESLAGDG